MKFESVKNGQNVIEKMQESVNLLQKKSKAILSDLDQV